MQTAEANFRSNERKMHKVYENQQMAENSNECWPSFLLFFFLFFGGL